MVAAAGTGELGVLLLAGVDLVRDHGPRAAAEAALTSAFVIAVDHELNDTTRHADVLLPAVLHAEARGTYTNWEGRVQASRPAVPVGGAAQTVWELVDQLSIALKVDLALASTAMIEAETAALRVRPGTGPVPARRATKAAPAAKAEAAPAGPEGLALVSYPLLNDGASLLRRAADLNRAAPAAFAELHPDTAAKLGLADGSTVALDFGEDRSARLPVRVAATTAPGCVFVPANQADLALGALLGPAAASGTVRVGVEPAQAEAAEVTEAAV
jgi:predicted molibdopterin-dependent oxidoreductase YjgC